MKDLALGCMEISFWLGKWLKQNLFCKVHLMNYLLMPWKVLGQIIVLHFANTSKDLMGFYQLRNL